MGECIYSYMVPHQFSIFRFRTALGYRKLRLRVKSVQMPDLRSEYYAVVVGRAGPGWLCKRRRYITLC